jgi:hypothetical protein
MYESVGPLEAAVSVVPVVATSALTVRPVKGGGTGIDESLVPVSAAVAPGTPLISIAPNGAGAPKDAGPGGAPAAGTLGNVGRASSAPIAHKGTHAIAASREQAIVCFANLEFMVVIFPAEFTSA